MIGPAQNGTLSVRSAALLKAGRRTTARNGASRNRTAPRRPAAKSELPSMPDFKRVAADVKLGRGVRIFGFANLYGCEVGDDTKIGAFVEIQKGARIGRRCKISSHTFICEGVTIEDEVFIGHNV